MKLEAGKRYVTRDGRVAGPIKANPVNSLYQFIGEIEGYSSFSWKPNGGFLETEHKHDLISEYIEPTQTVLSREWLQSEIATIERHIQGQPSPTLAALKLALERLDQIGTVKIPTSVDEAEMMEKLGFAYIKEHAPHRLTELGLARQIALSNAREIVDVLSAGEGGAEEFRQQLVSHFDHYIRRAKNSEGEFGAIDLAAVALDAWCRVGQPTPAPQAPGEEGLREILAGEIRKRGLELLSGNRLAGPEPSEHVGSVQSVLIEASLAAMRRLSPSADLLKLLNAASRYVNGYATNEMNHPQAREEAIDLHRQIIAALNEKRAK